MTRWIHADWKYNVAFGTLAIGLGFLALMRPDLVLALVAGTLGVNLILAGGVLLHTAWGQYQVPRRGGPATVYEVHGAGGARGYHEVRRGPGWVEMRQMFYR